MTRILRYTLWTTAIFAGVLFVSVTTLRVWAPYRQAAADRAWAESFESMDALAARYPTGPDSPAAVELASLVEPLGIWFERPETPASDRHAAALRSVVKFVGEQVRKTDDETLDPPAGDVKAFLSEGGVTLDAIETHLLGRQPIVWRIDVKNGLTTPPAPLLGLRFLTGALLARAFDASSRGDHRDAARSLEAARRLTLTVRDRPELISQLVFLAVDSLYAAALRRLPAASLAGVTLPQVRDWQAAMTRALQAETLQFGAAARGGGAPASSTGATMINRLRKLILIDMGLADYSDHMRRLALAMRAQDPCVFDPESFQKQTDQGVPRWNIVARVAVPGISRAWATAGRMALGDELTRLVVQAKMTVAGAALPASVPSAVCSGLTWTMATQPNGDVQIAADRNPFTDQSARPLLAFRVSRKAGKVHNGGR